MPSYRIYPLDPLGRIKRPIETEFASDGEAVAHASHLGERVAAGCELWAGSRFLGRFHFGAPNASQAPPEPPSP